MWEPVKDVKVTFTAYLSPKRLMANFDEPCVINGVHYSASNPMTLQIAELFNGIVLHFEGGHVFHLWVNPHLNAIFLDIRDMGVHHGNVPVFSRFASLSNPCISMRIDWFEGIVYQTNE